jgi:fumarylacetoacetate (FAA) hydrolase
MKLLSYMREGHDQLAVLVDGSWYDTDRLHPELPTTMGMFLNFWDDYYPIAKACVQAIEEKRTNATSGSAPDESLLLAPVPFPTSCRDGYAFRQHVAAARRNRGVPMIPDFDRFPVFYFTNHHGIVGPGAVACMPDHFERLDFELEAAIVICRQGRNIPASEADKYIGGLMVMNDLSARSLQMEEMQLSLGPAKGKDFATAIGPCLVTLDELEPFATQPKDGHVGKSWNLRMTARVNGVQVSEGRLSDMDWTFAEIVERASYGVNLFPGDVIGSGTVGTGCFLELNGTRRLEDPAAEEQWLREGDVVELEIEGIGVLRNTITREESDMSLLAKARG